MTRLLLVRHGQSVWNARGLWQGQADPPLTGLGHEQAEAAAGLEQVDAVATSDLVRAHQTAETLRKATGVRSLTVDPRLRERHAGEWQGLTREDIEHRYPGYLEDGHRPPGWESARELHRRTMDALLHLATAASSATWLVVTHGGVIYTIEEAHGIAHHRISNLGGRWLEIDDGESTLGERVDLLAGRAEATIPDQI